MFCAKQPAQQKAADKRENNIGKGEPGGGLISSMGDLVQQLGEGERGCAVDHGTEEKNDGFFSGPSQQQAGSNESSAIAAPVKRPVQKEGVCKNSAEEYDTAKKSASPGMANDGEVVTVVAKA